MTCPWSGRIRLAESKRPGPFTAMRVGGLVAALLLSRIATAVSVVEFPLSPPGTTVLPSGIAAGPDGNVWFTEYWADVVGRITTTGVITEFALPSGSSPWGITPGPDGNLWFTERGTSRIGRITPAGDVIEYTIPTANSGPARITAGPDGSLWFTEFNGGKIGRITTAGDITEFPIPTVASRAFGIACGSDGNLWFTESGSNRIGSITTAGVITEFTIPTPGSEPADITSGPDGNLWFAENAAGKIGRISPSGGIAEFPMVTANSTAFGITAHTDGNLWFTGGSGGVARITPSGYITELPALAPNSGPHSITSGPDGNLWITDWLTSSIGRISLGASLVSLAPCRLVDTRHDAGPDAAAPALGPSENRTFGTAARCGIPPAASAISVNITITSPTDAGYLALYPADRSLPPTSNINFARGQSRANNAIVSLAPDASGLKVTNGSPGSVHVILDVNGYFE